jgi:catechol 2,3-dioxygenase-like lactoylglutathione lyase family enzyme
MISIKRGQTYRQALPSAHLAEHVRDRYQVDEVLALAAAARAQMVKPAGEADWGGSEGHFTDPDDCLRQCHAGSGDLRRSTLAGPAAPGRLTSD